MLLLGPLTPTECMRPGHPWAYPEGRVPVRLSVFVRKGVFLLNRGSVDCRFADMLRHSQYTLMVIAVSTGLERARLLA